MEGYLFFIQYYTFIPLLVLIARGDFGINYLTVWLPVAASFGTIISFLANISSIQMSLQGLLGQHAGIAVFFAVMVLIPVIIVVLVFLAAKTGDYWIYKKQSRGIFVRISEKSARHVGGFLVFDIRHTSWLFAGYLVICIESPYMEQKRTLVKYDEQQRRGQLEGKFKDRQMSLRCTIPKDFGHGTYQITVSVMDVCAWSFLFRKTTRVSSKRIRVRIESARGSGAF